MTRSDRRLLGALARVHGLGFRERRFCRRLAFAYGLDGTGGPETSPAMIFFRPSFWEVFLRDMRSGEDRRLPAGEIERLRAKIFGE